VSFLLDTCILSQGIKGEIDHHVALRLLEIPSGDQFASVVSLAEIKSGVERLPDGRRKQQLIRWFEVELRPWLADRVISFDEECAMVWALLRVQSPNAKFADGQIAATALAHGLTLVTRNVRDFAFAGVPVFNPWSK
jgi:predicted nucleic acid-binding protein